MRTLVWNESRALQVLDRSIVELYPRLRELTVSGEVFLDPASPRAQWLDLRRVAEFPISNVKELLIRLALYGSIEHHLTSMPADDLRRSLGALDCTLFDAIIHAYWGRIVRLEIHVQRTSLTLEAAQLPDTICL